MWQDDCTIVAHQQVTRGRTMFAERRNPHPARSTPGDSSNRRQVCPPRLGCHIVGLHFSGPSAVSTSRRVSLPESSSPSSQRDAPFFEYNLERIETRWRLATACTILTSPTTVCSQSPALLGLLCDESHLVDAGVFTVRVPSYSVLTTSAVYHVTGIVGVSVQHM